MAWRGLTKQQWEAIRVHLPVPKVSPRGGRPRIDDRRCFEGILWILWTGAQWSELPRQYGSPSTCWRRLKSWEETGVLLKLWRASLSPRKKGAQSWHHQAGQGHEVDGSGRWRGDLRWEHTWTRRPRRRLPSLS